MAKKRIILGSILKGKEGKPDYIQINRDYKLKKGQFLNLESKAMALKALDASVAAGKLSGDLVDKIRSDIEKTPDFVRFQIFVLEEKTPIPY